MVLQSQLLRREISVPFQVGPSGSIDSTTDPIEQLNFHLISVIGTNPGERVMRPDYGVPVSQAVFEPGDQLIATELKNQITQAIRRWEPRVLAIEVTPTAEPYTSGGALIFEVRYQLQGSGETHTAVISVGGMVNESTAVRAP